MTREESIKTLTNLGYYAKSRDWSLGKTIMIGVNPRTEIRDGLELQIFDDLLYIYPVPNKETWKILSDEEDHEFSSLEEVIAQVAKLVDAPDLGSGG